MVRLPYTILESLFRRYILHVEEQEGIDFIEHSYTKPPFTEGEIAVLLMIKNAKEETTLDPTSREQS